MNFFSQWVRHLTSIAGKGLIVSLFVTGIAQAAEITSVTVSSDASTDQSGAIVTFGHVFKPGDIRSGYTLRGTLPNGDNVPLQVNKKATHGDGSLRHAIVNAKLAIGSGESQIVTLHDTPDTTPGAAITLSELLNTNFDAQVSIRENGTTYTASAADLLSNGSPTQWLSGPLVSEWIVGGPVKTSGGSPHPHLAAYFHVRVLEGLERARVDVVVENNWTFASSPRAFTYDVTIDVGGSTVYSANSLTHYHHTRWHKQFWWGDDPALAVSHNPEYLQSTQAVPNYQANLSPSASALNGLTTQIQPMDNADLRERFADTGAGTQIGPLPLWDALYAVSGDNRAFASSLANASAGGSYSIHYRDQNTGLPVSIETHPRLSENGGTAPPTPSGGTAFSHDQAHHPSIGYMAYLISGDYFYLEELMFWANWNMVWTNPDARGEEKGIFSVQNRGQVWSIRTLAQAAYIAPDAHPMKQYFVDRVNYNIADRANYWPSKNNLGAIQDYDYPQYSPWQNDWFVWVFGYLVELGFDQAQAMRDWLSKWPTGRMGITDTEFCFQYAPSYKYDAAIGPTRTTFYDNFRILYEENYPDKSDISCDPNGEMSGYPHSTMGYYSNMQPALAIAVDAGVADYDVHWARFVGAPTTPVYDDNPIWAIVPRSQTGDPRPTIALSATPSSLNSAGDVSLSWSTLNADTCSASGAWAGSKQTSSSTPEVVSIAQDSTFTLSCTGAGGTASRSVTVTISSSGGGSSPDSDSGSSDSSSSSSTDSGGGGGGGAVPPNLLVGLLLLLFARTVLRRRH